MRECPHGYSKQAGRQGLSDTLDSAQKFNGADYRFSGGEIKINLFTNPFIADDFWTELAEREDFRLIMPFIATIFISIGFYAEAVLGLIYRIPCR